MLPRNRFVVLSPFCVWEEGSFGFICEVGTNAQTHIRAHTFIGPVSDCTTPSRSRRVGGSVCRSVDYRGKTLAKLSQAHTQTGFTTTRNHGRVAGVKSFVYLCFSARNTDDDDDGDHCQRHTLHLASGWQPSAIARENDDDDVVVHFTSDDFRVNGIYTMYILQRNAAAIQLKTTKRAGHTEKKTNTRERASECMSTM